MSLWSLPGLMIRALSDPAMCAWIVYAILPGWLLLPCLHRLLPGVRVGWYFAARVAAIALLGYLPWLLSHDGNPTPLPFDQRSLLLLLLLMGFAGGTSWWRWGRESRERICAEKREIIVGEAIFLLSLAFAGALRLVSHGIVGQEKFMDMAFFRSCIDASTMPPADPWLHHLPINYYYGGYAILAAPAKLFGTGPAVAYNLAAAFVFALTASMVFALGCGLTRRIAGGIMACFLVLLAGNMAVVLQFARHLRTLPHAAPFVFDWWEPSRVLHDRIPGADPASLITEFPFFSFFHSDLHPHLMVMPFALLFLCCLMAVLDGRSGDSIRPVPGRMVMAGRFLLTAWSLGLLIWINPFDFIGWGLLAGVAFLLPNDGKMGWRGFPRSLGIYTSLVVLACVLVSPFLASYTLPRSAESGGFPIGMTEFRTAPWEFLLAWGLPMAIVATWLGGSFLAERRTFRRESRFLLDAALGTTAVVAALVLGGWVAGFLFVTFALAMRRALCKHTNPTVRSATLLVAVGLLLLLACELLHIRDPYGRALQRMNTVFKFHFIAWTMIGLAAPCLLMKIWKGLTGAWPRRMIFSSLLVLAALAASYPILATRERLRTYESLDLGPPSYDGLRFLGKTQPADLEAIRWLAGNAKPGEVLLEAVGGAYGEHGRVSVFSPVRAVLGWANHERVWRGMDTSTIEEDVRQIYRGSEPDETIDLLEKYSVDYVYIGSLERREYPAESLDRFATLLTPAYQDDEGGVIIYRVADPRKRGR